LRLPCFTAVNEMLKPPAHWRDWLQCSFVAPISNCRYFFSLQI